MNAEEHSTRTLEVEGWQVRITSYKFGDEYHCTADNVSPGANICRTTGATRQEAEDAALAKAKAALARTRRFPAGA